MSGNRNPRGNSAGWRVASSLIVLMTLALSVIPVNAQETDPAPEPAPAAGPEVTTPDINTESVEADIAQWAPAEPGSFGVAIDLPAPDVEAGPAVIQAPEEADPDRLTFDEDRSVADTVATLDGAQLEKLASQSSLSVEQLSQLAADPTARVGESGAVYFEDPVDEAQLGALEAEDADAEVAAAPFPLNQTFILHSRPGASKKIYLDFNGYALPAGTAWRGGAALAAPAMDTSGNGAAFDNAELERIQGIWQRVSEDYAPFDVDVTTQDPGYAAINRASVVDNFYGTRVVISSINGVATGLCSSPCGGVAYVGTYDFIGANHDYYQPAWVFPGSLSNREKSIAEAASHEAGHNLGLSHDGTATSSYYSGHAMWAPIMGNGYSRPVTQFSRGLYTGANNAESDFDVMLANGLSYRADDHADLASPTNIGLRTNAYSGVVELQADLDAFSFVGCGNEATVDVDPAPVSPNLDTGISVYTSANSFLGASVPVTSYVNSDYASGMDAAYTGNFTYGTTYKTRVYGQPSGNAVTGFERWGSRGQYTVDIDRPEGSCDAWALLDQPTTANYTISNGRWRNPAGAAPTVNRTATGRYSVTWPGLTIAGGNIQVTSTRNGTTCNVVNWGTTTANIACFTSAGTPVDAGASVMFTHDPNDVYAYSSVLASPSYTPSSTWSNNPEGTITITHGAAGTYTVLFPGFNATGGHAQVTAYGLANTCQIRSWGSTSANVYCFDFSGNPTDSRFSFLFTDSTNDSYAWANNASSASYSPNATYLNSPTGPADAGLVSTGHYRVTFSGLEAGRGNVQISPYGAAATTCAVTGWSNNTADIWCRNAVGAATNTLFNVLYTPGAPVYCAGRIVTVDLNVGDTPTNLDDVILGTPLGETINAGGGNDTVCAGEGNDTVRGGAGNDYLLGEDGNDLIDGGDGTDTAAGGNGDDRIIGGNDNDFLYGQADNDQITGGDGDDYIDGSDGNDRLSGGDDDDTIYGRDGNDILAGQIGDDYIAGGRGDDVVNGDAGNDQLHGEDGDDRVSGGGGTDTVTGGEGNDRTLGGDGDDNVDGGAGDDIVIAGNGNDTARGGDGADNVTGGNGIDSVYGDAGNDEVAGGGDNDTVSGGDGDDRLTGQSGDDTLLGEGGNDDMFGDAGNDTCNGGPGVDFAAATCETVIGVP